VRLFRSGRRILFLLVHRFVSKSGFTCSCAWRHCGAEADAQEALAELNNLSGVLEPFECEFIIDIVDRSLRDMIAVIPQKYLIQERVAMYQPYESKNIMDNTNEESSIDQDYLQAMENLRQDLLE